MNEIKEKLDKRQDLREYLFCRGFLLTDSCIDTKGYPFYGNWKEYKVQNYTVYVHSLQKITIYESSEISLVLIGHAYNPFTMEDSEDLILRRIAVSSNRIDSINELTGVFFLAIISNGRLAMHVDASSMQAVCYGVVNNHIYVSSHMRLVGDLLNLEMTDYVSRLINYRWYHFMMGNYLPGDITCFKELTRVVPNTYVTFAGGRFKVTRFYPAHEIDMCQNDDEYWEVVNEAATIMKNTMALIPQKWNDPAISLTGGIDSNTTFAAANGVYEEYKTFSYVSMYRESVDAEMAQIISNRFNVPWKKYDVPEKNEEISDFDTFKQVIEWNGGGIGHYHDSDIRKKIVLMRNDVCDVEVKSWISETVRAYAYKYFGRTSFHKNLTARNYTSLYKIFALNRRLVHETDVLFRQYWRHTKLKEHLFNYDETDFFVWEMMHGGKCGLDIGVMKTCFDITIPYNNRKLLDLLLRVPLEKRLSDQLHLDLKKIMNRELYDMNIRVINLNETSLRKKLANVYFTLNSRLPF